MCTKLRPHIQYPFHRSRTTEFLSCVSQSYLIYSVICIIDNLFMHQNHTSNLYTQANPMHQSNTQKNYLPNTNAIHKRFCPLQSPPIPYPVIPSAPQGANMYPGRTSDLRPLPASTFPGNCLVTPPRLAKDVTPLYGNTAPAC